jgi:Domain of unknown function (DUF6249)
MNLNRFTDLVGHTLACTVICLFMCLPLVGLADDTSATAPTTASSSAPPGADIAANNQALQGMIKGFTHESDVADNALIPLSAIFLIFGGPVILIITLAGFHYRTQQRLALYRRDTIAALIDAGKDVPESLLFFDDLGGKQTLEKTLHRGLKNIGLGLGLIVFLCAMYSLQAGTFGLIFIGLGLAQVLSWKLTQQKI